MAMKAENTKPDDSLIAEDDSQENIPDGLLQDGYTGELFGKLESSATRLMIGIPVTGLVRIEWVMSRYGQVIPCNWSQVEAFQSITNQISPMNFLVADARNIIVHKFLEQKWEWLLFIDHDTMLPPTGFLQLNEYMLAGDVPVVAGLYFTRSVPAEPLIYRGRGNSYYNDWKMGDKVWCDGIPMGCTLIHNTVLRALYDESADYSANGQPARRVFENPQQIFYDPEKRTNFAATGTEDLRFCTKVMKGNIFKKAGWPAYTSDVTKYPFLVDTNIFCRHIDQAGQQYPAAGEEKKFERGEVK